MEDKDGGTAFPIIHQDRSGVQYWGVSIRDYFAAQAMAIVAIKHNGDLCTSENTAAKAYRLADAMLKERAK